MQNKEFMKIWSFYKKNRIILLSIIIIIPIIFLILADVAFFSGSNIFDYYNSNYKAHSGDKYYYGLGSDDSSNDNPDNSVGAFDGEHQYCEDQLFSRINWKDKQYFKYRNDSLATPNYQNQRFYVNWPSSPANGSDPDTADNPQAITKCDLPNTGSEIYLRYSYGTDILKTNVWNTTLSTSDPKPLIKNVSSNVCTLAKDKIAEASNPKYIDTYFDFGMDFGQNFGFYRSFNNITNSEKFNFYDQDYLFANKIFKDSGVQFNNTESSNRDSVNDMGINLADSEKTSDFAQNYSTYYMHLSPIFFFNNTSLPYYGVNLYYTHGGSTYTYYFAAFGMIINGKYFTMIIENNQNCKNITNSKYTQNMIIVDRNASLASQQSELNDIFRLDTGYTIENGNVIRKPYSNDIIPKIINSLNGKIKNQNSLYMKNFLNAWDVQSRELISTTNKNNFTAGPTNYRQNNAIPITQDKKDKAFPKLDLNTGFHPDDFANNTITEYWKDSHVNNYPDTVVLSAFKTVFDIQLGYNRDAKNVTIDDKKYFASYFPVFDCAFFYTTRFDYSANYNNKIFSPSLSNIDYYQDAFSVENPVIPLNNPSKKAQAAASGGVGDSPLNTFSRSLVHFLNFNYDQVKNPYAIKLVYKSNNKLSVGGYVSIGILGLFVSYPTYVMLNFLYIKYFKKSKVNKQGEDSVAIQELADVD